MMFVHTKNLCTRELSKRCKEIGFQPERIAEVGVGAPEQITTGKLLKDAKSVILVEPHPGSFRRLTKLFEEDQRIEVIQKAIFPKRGQQKFQIKGGSSYLDCVKSPESRKGSKLLSIMVEAIPFSDIDPGNLDLVALDCEGSEWFVISTMTSRPRVITVEMALRSGYRNPYYDEIVAWMKEEGYRDWYTFKADHTWIKD